MGKRRKNMNKKVVLYGFGMVVPRLGEPYTLTIKSAEILANVTSDIAKREEEIGDDKAGRVRLGELLGRKTVCQYPAGGHEPFRRFTHTFTKVRFLEDTGKPGCGAGTIRIKGISAEIGGMYVEAEIDYPAGYNPPVII